MVVYWLMFIIPILLGLSPIKADHHLKKNIFFLSGIVLLILIGLRHEIGGDWFRYVDTAYGISEQDDFDFTSFYTGDYGYRLIHWLSVVYLDGIYSTNLICAFFFIIGLFKFSRAMPVPWIALCVSVPFMIVVVSMGYTRQSVALGFLMWALTNLINEKTRSFYILLIIGSLFHLTLMIMIPIGVIYNSFKPSFKGLLFIFLLITLLSMYAYFLFSKQIEHMIYYYITIKFHHSDGAVMRVFVNFLSAILFFIYREEFKRKFHDEKLWFIFSLLSILMFPAAFFYSTLVDRVVIYLMPLQLVIASRVVVLITSKYNRTLFVFMVIIMYSSILFTWLNFGNFSSYWLPYQNILINY